MTLENFTVVNRRLEEERRKQYCGTASLRLTSLQYQVKPAHLDAMTSMFRQEHGCRKEDNRHHVKALISQQDLEAAMVHSAVSSEMLMADTLPYPELEFPVDFQIECIEGHDRLAAADKVLQGSKKRWIVDIYLNDLSDELRILLADGYDYQKKPDDGELYVKIRQFQGHYGNINPFFENLWLARLATNENKWRLYNQLARHKRLSTAFDKLLDIPGLFGGFRLSVMHQLLGMRCDEPNLAYLNHIYRWWSDIFEGDKAAMQQVTRDTVVALQGMAPGACSTDREILLGKMKGRIIFENFPDSRREKLWERICNTSRRCLIPSLFTFFEDRKFLSDAAGAIRKVLDVNRKDTIASCLEQIFTDHSQEKDKCIIQVSETTFAYIVGDSNTRLDLGIRQIWLAAFRNCREMPAETQKEDLLALSRTKTNEFALYELASLASRLGFESDKLNELSRKSVDQEIAAAALLNARKPGRYKFHNRDECIQQMVSIFESAVPVSIDEAVDTALKVIRENGQSPQRFGRPNNADYEFDKTRLFLPHMHDDIVEIDKMTSIFVRWSAYCAYFGHPPLETTFKEDDGAMLGVEFSECKELEIPKQSSRWSMANGEKESALTTARHEFLSYDMSQLKQLKQTLEEDYQKHKDIVQQIEANNLILKGQKQTLRETKEKIENEGTKLEQLALNQKDVERQTANLIQTKNEYEALEQRLMREHESKKAEIQAERVSLEQQLATEKQFKVSSEKSLKELQDDLDQTAKEKLKTYEELAHLQKNIEKLKLESDLEQKKLDNIKQQLQHLEYLRDINYTYSKAKQRIEQGIQEEEEREREQNEEKQRELKEERKRKRLKVQEENAAPMQARIDPSNSLTRQVQHSSSTESAVSIDLGQDSSTKDSSPARSPAMPHEDEEMSNADQSTEEPSPESLKVS